MDKVKYVINIISDNMAAADSMFVNNEESGGDEENILVFPTFSQVEEVKEEVIRWYKVWPKPVFNMSTFAFRPAPEIEF